MEPAFVKQIAGRAGRASSKHKEGIATAWQDVDLAYIRSVMEEETPQVKQAGLFPIIEQVEYFAQQLAQLSTDQTTRLSSLLGKFVELAQVDGRYAISEHSDLLAISNFLQPVPLTLAQRCVLLALARTALQAIVHIICLRCLLWFGIRAGSHLRTHRSTPAILS